MSRLIIAAPVVALLLVSGCSSGASTDELQRANAAGAAAAKADAEASAAAEKADAAASAAAAKKDAETAKLKAEVDKLKAAQDTAAADAAKASTAAHAAATKRAATAAATTSCGDNVSAGGTTSCSFALNVAYEWRYYGTGTTDVMAYSPVTRETIAMHCVAGVPTVCRGGRAAVVYIR